MPNTSVALGLFASLNLATFAAFAWDKQAARAYARRLPERLLLLLALVGGSPAAKLAQRYLRHKTVKQPFVRRLNAIVALHGILCAAGIYFALASGA